MRQQGHQWVVYPKPSKSSLYPNMKNSQSYPWTHTKKAIAKKLYEITLIRNCTVKHRRSAHANGVLEFNDPRITSKMLGFSASTQTAHLVSSILSVNSRPLETKSDLPEPAPLIEPGWFHKTLNKWAQDHPLYHWYEEEDIEFYTDFETISSVHDNYGQYPSRQDTTRIAVIGVGYWSRSQKIWISDEFVIDRLDDTAETQMIDRWLTWMNDKQKKEATGGPTTKKRVWHWTKAEPRFFESNYNSSVIRLNATIGKTKSNGATWKSNAIRVVCGSWSTEL